ncbi:protein prenylyltransferase [Backusella circina FSU 941]|nr:protein prenylyltransferase [Backusella circina FSU 941]
MADVHGRKRVKTTEELIQARREKEAVKIKEYTQLVTKCHQLMAEKQYTLETLSLTTQIVQWNPDFYTIWNYRRTILLNGILEEDSSWFEKDLGFFMQLVRINPKSYWLWNHRIWCLETMPNPDWKAELGLVEKMLTLDARNFHGWNYRRFVVGHLRALAKTEEEVKRIAAQEYEFTTRKINQSFSNYSAWHQRSKLIPEIVKDMSEEERNQVAMNELDLVKNAIYTDPEDQSAWLYYWWLVGKVRKEVSLLGAYRLEGSNIVIIGFDDHIKWITELKGKVLPIHPTAGDAASLWAFMPEIDTLERFQLDAGSVLPSSSARCVPENKVWDVEIKTLSRPGAEKRIERLKLRFEQEEWHPSNTKMYKDPTAEDQSSWYTLDKLEMLKTEIETVRELIEIEPESAWAFQTLAHFLQQLHILSADDDAAYYTEMSSIFDRLGELDKARTGRYLDQKSQVMFEQATFALIKNQKYNEDPSVLTQVTVETIPILSSLLLVHEITPPPSLALQGKLNALPFLY